MKRSVYKQLLKWKNSQVRKPLIVNGARQVGKTWLLKEFAKNEYDSVAYFNFEENPELNSLFDKNLEPQRLISELSAVFGSSIKAGTTLIIFDEIQCSNKCLTSLKYFNEKANEYHIACAGSLLGIKLSTPRAFPVGKVDFIDVHPMSFTEYLRAVGKQGFCSLINCISNNEPLSEFSHNELCSLLKSYLFVGGMPEVVASYASNHDYINARDIQKKILQGYENDFLKYAARNDSPKISYIWKSLPSQLARENKKFVYKAVKTGARAREYESALQWLEDAGLIFKVYHISKPELPLRAFSNMSAFKIYLFDTGLLGAMAEIPVKEVTDKKALFFQFNGALTENFVVQELSARQTKLFYWTGKTSEVDFVYQARNELSIIPLEVKAGINTKSKSLKAYRDKFQAKCWRTSLQNFKEQDWVTNYPLYATRYLP
ncbi:MAG: ATP-binding protein [Lentisphaeraceae bacterium]|nr:ATP-binding protein [Lentisphaeraceae bacterium]